ncbi:tRNA(His) guanylyltransferase Thg1 family protein [Xanthocytophaga flava]|uniref:tRNA(His) guanylyltransferase Thg1 family protein n=1 Tax=Xanthocytophaga flava TaxID=3048013 RepID=UPI0028D2A3EC|nr:tRNA(His) guanylyltransferase Thg1 family protein [Xanthocytophaga flavus]MDJ1468305.1 tRNA(His) guanylyltransferase Thg1 family protein [Xanthocytophaga flavus]
MKDTLGDRMKMYYEDRTRFALPRRTYTIIRIDGKAFHTYTRGLARPFDDQFMQDMDATASFLCANIQGTRFAYVQSDEISIALTDFDKLTTAAWFDGNIQKMVSISASLATAKFNELRPGKLAYFDSRVFTIPFQIEVENYFIWRQQDATRNSISNVAQSLYTHKELINKSSVQKQELIFQKGINWNDYAPRYKRGRIITKESFEKQGALRNRWTVSDVPIFTQDRSFLQNLLTPVETE